MSKLDIHSTLRRIGKAEFLDAFPICHKHGSISVEEVLYNAQKSGRDVSKSAKTKADNINRLCEHNLLKEALLLCFNIKDNPDYEHKAESYYNEYYSDHRYELWQSFLDEWPISRLKSMSYAEYNKAGNNESFCYWLEKKTELLGRIGGVNSFIFGIYSRKDKVHKENKNGRIYTENDAWYERFGNTAEDAFKTVRSYIVRVATYADAGEYHKINDIDLSEILKWKIAFLYQPRIKISLLSIFNPQILMDFLNISEKQSTSSLHSQIRAQYSEEEIFKLSEYVIKQSKKRDSQMQSNDAPSKNIILYGPPGTGKTFHIRSEEPAKHPELAFLDDIPKENIRHVTFHPSYSYEDFIEGIFPALEKSKLTESETHINTVSYEYREGILKRISKLAETDKLQISSTKVASKDIANNNVWKMSLGDTLNSDDHSVFDFCIEHNVALYGFMNHENFSTLSSDYSNASDYIETLDSDNFVIKAMTRQFVSEMKKDDIILVSKGNTGGIRAIGIVAGPYKYEAYDLEAEGVNPGYKHSRTVTWIWSDNENTIPAEKLLTKNISQRTLYNLYRSIDREKLKRLLSNTRRSENYALIIDEINRGDVAKIFGELITLIEDDKRGQEVSLPSGDSFSIPPNLYIIGTMNTADRSLTHLDTALRRRFHFIEMQPNPSVLDNTMIGDINLSVLLASLNDRMEVLLGRDYMLGHAYFMKEGKAVSTNKDLHHVIMNKVLPQLQEYFYDDYSQIQIVLGCDIIEKHSLKNLPGKLRNNETYRIINLSPDALVAAIAQEYNFSTASVSDER